MTQSYTGACCSHNCPGQRIVSKGSAEAHLFRTEYRTRQSARYRSNLYSIVRPAFRHQQVCALRSSRQFALACVHVYFSKCSGVCLQCMAASRDYGESPQNQNLESGTWQRALGGPPILLQGRHKSPKTCKHGSIGRIGDNPGSMPVPHARRASACAHRSAQWKV